MAENDGLDKRVFDFFGLPRELRNEVYAHLNKDLCVNSGYDQTGELIKPQTYATAVPIPHVLRICRQLKTEYEEAFKGGFTITFKDLGAPDYEPALEGDLDKFTKAEALILAHCDLLDCPAACGAYRDLESHVQWMQTILPRLNNLRDLRVRVYQCQLHDAETSSGQIHPPNQPISKQLDKLVKRANLSRLEVYPFMKVEGSGEATDGVKAYESAQATEKVWTKETGWQ